MPDFNIVSVKERAELAPKAARWFCEKWSVPEETYLASMNECIAARGAVPQWFVVLDKGEIIAGLGVVENDFHDRKDLAPNVAALYVEREYRNRGIAGRMLKRACGQLARAGVRTLYLVTDHAAFYERYGWKFLFMAQPDGGKEKSRVYIHTYTDSDE